MSYFKLDVYFLKILSQTNVSFDTRYAMKYRYIIRREASEWGRETRERVNKYHLILDTCVSLYLIHFEIKIHRERGEREKINVPSYMWIAFGYGVLKQITYMYVSESTRYMFLAN